MFLSSPLLSLYLIWLSICATSCLSSCHANCKWTRGGGAAAPAAVADESHVGLLQSVARVFCVHWTVCGSEWLAGWLDGWVSWLAVEISVITVPFRVWNMALRQQRWQQKQITIFSWQFANKLRLPEYEVSITHATLRHSPIHETTFTISIQHLHSSSQCCGGCCCGIKIHDRVQGMRQASRRDGRPYDEAGRQPRNGN